MSTEESEKEDRSIEEYKQLEKQKENIRSRIEKLSLQETQTRHTLLQRGEECLKELLRLGKKMKTMSPYIQFGNLREIHKLSLVGIENARISNDMKTDEIVWTRKAMLYADMAVILAKTMYGEEHSLTKECSAFAKEHDADFRMMLRE